MAPTTRPGRNLNPRREGKAGDTPSTYDHLVNALITAPGYEGGYSTRVSATVVVINDAPRSPGGDRLLARTVIFPEQVVLSPGESTNLYLIGTDNSGQPMSNLNVNWSLMTPDLGQISRGGVPMN